MRVADALGAGERGRYLLAATFGNVHGVYAPGNVKLRPELLREGQEALARRVRARAFSTSFTAAAGRPRPMCARRSPTASSRSTSTPTRSTRSRAPSPTTSSANYDGVLRIDGDLGRKGAYDPRSWGREAEAALATRVAEATQLFGSASRSVLR